MEPLRVKVFKRRGKGRGREREKQRENGSSENKKYFKNVK